MRLVVTGLKGQVVTALGELGRTSNVTVLPIGRPDFDLATPTETNEATIAGIAPDVIVSAAAYTAVDKAESERDLAFAVNAEGPARLAAISAKLGIPIIHVSTDFVFDGTKSTPYVETDPVAPLGVYGESKLAGEQAVAIYPNHVVLRTAWVFSPFGNNFVRTMLRLGETRDRLRVVADQSGNPTSALDLAAAILAIAGKLAANPLNGNLRGIFHFAGRGDATWADLAEAVFEAQARMGGKRVGVERITTADYPTPARRPANSRLATRKIEQVHGLTIPNWRASLTVVVDRLLSDKGVASENSGSSRT